MGGGGEGKCGGGGMCGPRAECECEMKLELCKEVIMLQCMIQEEGVTAVCGYLL